MIRTTLALIVLLFSSILSATEIQLTWGEPELNEDGSKIKTIDRYNLYQTTNNVLQSVVEIPANSTSFSIPEAPSGTHTFQISTVAAGQEGALSDPITVSISEAKPAKIELTVKIYKMN